MQIVLHIGNALNAGTARGNAAGFRPSALLKLAEHKAADKKTTLLHYTVEVVQTNAPKVRRVTALLPTLAQAAPRLGLAQSRTISDNLGQSRTISRRPPASRSRSCAPRAPTSPAGWTRLEIARDRTRSHRDVSTATAGWTRWSAS